MFSKKRILAMFTATGLALSLMSAPALAKEVEGPVTNLGKCSSRNKVAYDAEGIEYKCSIAGGGLKWKKTGGKKGAGASTSTSTTDTKIQRNMQMSVEPSRLMVQAPLHH